MRKISSPMVALRRATSIVGLILGTLTALILSETTPLLPTPEHTTLLLVPSPIRAAWSKVLIRFLDGCILCSFILRNFFGAGGGSATSFEVFWNNVSVYSTSNPPVSNYWETRSLCEPQPAPRHHYGSFTSTPLISGILMMCP